MARVKTPKGILEYFPRGLRPREGQRQALLAVEANWDSSDVIVIEAPTAAGKSEISKTIAKWASGEYKWKTHIGVPNNMLVAQGAKDGTFSLKKKHEYQCLFPLEGETFSCEEGQKRHGTYCSSCPYVKSLRMARALPYQVSNYYTYMAHKLYADVFLADEGHLLLPMIQSLMAKKLWYRDYKWPHNVRTYQQLLDWAQEAHGENPEDKKLKTLYEDLQSGRNQYLVEKGFDRLRGHEEGVLKLLPVDTSSFPKILWPPHRVKKIVLMSATIGRKDLQQMGLEGLRVAWISVPSPIEAWRRPVIRDCHLDIRYGCDTAEYGKLAAYIEEVCSLFPGHKGLVHMPYSLADRMRALLTDERYLFHTKANKMAKFEEFKRSDDKVLVCSGLYEGVDLPLDLGRFQVLATCPWLSLADSAVKYKAETDRDWYLWECLKTVVQGSGRICRTPEDFGYTFLAAKSTLRLPEAMYPGYFADAVKAGESWKSVNPPPGRRAPGACRVPLE